jgi:hypothetical protein
VGNRGQIGSYLWGQYWQEEPELYVPDVARGLREFLIGLRSANVSYDSGRLGQRVPLPTGWNRVQDYAVSPPITDELVANWPRSEHGFDEWYFFRDVPVNLEVEAFCNWYAFGLSQWEILRGTDNGFDLSAQLERLQPEAVIGESHSIFVISRNAQVVEQFLGLAREP